jgi:hypothetical protein
MRSFVTLTLHPILLWAIKSKRMRWAGQIERMGEMGSGCSILVGRYEGKRPLGRTTRVYPKVTGLSQ